LGHTTLERRDTITTVTTNPETQNVVEPNFDENVLRMLCDLDVSDLLGGTAAVWNSMPPFDRSALSRCYWTESNRARCRARCVVRPQPAVSGNQLFLQEASAFFKRRAMLEDEYGRNLQKLARSTSELYAMSEGKAG